MTDTPLADSLTVQNVVSSTTIDHELDLQPLADDLDGGDYRTTPAPTITYQPLDTDTIVWLFRSGTLLVIGAASRPAARTQLTHAIDDLDDLAIPVPDDPAISIRNMVFTADLDTSLQLSAVAIGLGLEQTEYEPEQHPAVIYRPPEAPVVVLVFATGKLVLTGSTDPAPATAALMTLADQLADLGLRQR